MSLNIDLDDVTDVLLADGWHPVADRSFTVNAYEWSWSGWPEDFTAQGPVSLGFAFREDAKTELVGPITAILAIKRQR